MERATLLLPAAPLFESERQNWPPPPKVKEYDANGIEKQRPPDSSDIAELKRDRAIFLFEGMNTAKLADSISTVELERSELRGGPSKATTQSKLDLEVDPTRSSLLSIEDSVSKLLAVETGSGDNAEEMTNTSDGKGQTSLMKKKSQKKRLIENVPKAKKKGASRQIPRMSRLALARYLRTWDKGSNSEKNGLIHKFLEDYTSQDPLDLDVYLSKGGSLIFIRFIVGMQISFQCKKPVAHHFMALGIFIKSLTGERYTYEFGLAGGFQTSFEVLRVHEMTNHDKMHAFHFLLSIIEGKGGCSAKRFLCNETSYLECVVDCLTMCQNENVIKDARQFLQNLCFGNTIKNLVMISKYIISLLPCDFNPQIQAMACDVLTGIINQAPEVASSCCTLVVDVLKSNYDDALVDVGNICLAIMGTPTADELLFHLIEAAQPYNLLENLMSPGVISRAGDGNEFDDIKSSDRSEQMRETEHISLENDPYFRLQYGAIYVLSYMVKNQTESADWMIERGVIGSLLSGIGTPCYTSVQLEAIRLLLLLHELSPDCSLALASLFPQKLLTALLTEHEDMLRYVTAVMCLVLRRLGARVQENWNAWFTQVMTPGSGHKPSIPELKSDEAGGEGEEAEESHFDALYEIDVLVELLEKSLSDPFVTIVESMKLIFPDPSVVEPYRNGPRPQSIHDSVSRQTMQKYHEKLTVGEEHILETETLEPFRKYLRKDNVIIERVDEFEKYYAAKFIMASEAQSLDMDAMQVAALQDAEQALKSFKDPFKIAESTAEPSKEVGDDAALYAMDDDVAGSGQDQMLNL